MPRCGQAWSGRETINVDKKMSFMITGKSALLCHNPAAMEQPKDKGKATKGKAIYDPVVEAEAGLYIDDGKCCFPGIGVRNSIIKAAGDWKPLSGKKRGSLTTTVAHIIVEPEMIPIIDAKGKPMKSYDIDRRRAVVQRQGIIRSRPKFSNWHLRFDIVYDADIIPMDDNATREMFTGLLNDAGKRVGIGDYRPAKTGWFGMFTCE